MKKIILILSIFLLILATSLIKRSTKNIEDKIFIVNENIRSLNSRLGDVLLEYNYLSSPEKLLKYQSQFFEKELTHNDITKIKIIVKKNNELIIKDFINKENETDKR
tara:strand:- start:1018 stop:1338 length:321 start_codon:yes stop_codon:yes gene_type:complete